MASVPRVIVKMRLRRLAIDIGAMILGLGAAMALASVAGSPW